MWFALQIADFNHRRALQSFSSAEQHGSKEDEKKREPEQELEVPRNNRLFVRAEHVAQRHRPTLIAIVLLVCLCGL